MIDEENEEVSPLQLSEDEAVAIERTLDDLDLALDGNGSAVEQVKRWQTLLENLTAKDHVCTVDALMGDEPMWLPAIDKDWPYKQQVDVLRALLLMDNARKLASGGYRDGMLFLPWTKPGSEGHREVRTVVRSVAGEYSEQLFKVGAVGTALATISCAHKHKKDGSWSCGSPNAEVRELLVRSLTGDTFPRLRGLVSSPRYALLDDGSLYLANREGYDPRTLFWLTRSFDGVTLDGPAPPEAEVAAALNRVRAPFAEFPFKSQADADNVLALVMTLALRGLFEVSPAFIVTASDPASGKSLLVELATALTLGFLPDVTALGRESSSSDMMARNLSKFLAEGVGSMNELIWADEAKRSGVDEQFVMPLLNAFLTSASGIIYDRPVYGRNVVPIHTGRTFILSANRLHAGREMVRRSLVIELDRPVAATWSTDEVTLREQALAGQAEYQAAIAVLVRNWVAKGMPPASDLFPSFARWQQIVVGILEAAAVSEVRGNVGGPDAYSYEARTYDLMRWVVDNVEPIADAAATPPDNSSAYSISAVADAFVGPDRRAAQALIVNALDEAPAEYEKLWDGLVRAVDGYLPSMSEAQRVKHVAVVAKAFGRVVKQAYAFPSVRHGEDGASVKVTRFSPSGKGHGFVWFRVVEAPPTAP